MLFQENFLKMSRIFRFFLSVLSGIFLSLPWLGFPGWILFVALVPLFLLQQFFLDHESEYGSLAYWGYSLLSFLIWNGLCTWWITYATLAGALMAIIVNSFLMSIVWWLGHLARLKLRSVSGYLAVIVFWISFEFFHFHWDIEWPWLTMGNGFANNVKIIQWYEYTGVLGGTLWVLIINVLIHKLLTFYSGSIPLFILLKRGIVLIIFLVIPLMVSFVIYYNYYEKEDTLNVVIVQPNINPYSEAWDSRAEMDKLKKFLIQADKKTDHNTDLVVGPESVFERYDEWEHRRLPVNFFYIQMKDWMMNYQETELIFGASTSKIYSGKEDASPTARKTQGFFYDVFNSAVFIGRDGSEQLYHKSILVPGVEKMPFKRYLGFLNDIVFNLGGTTGSLGIQDEPSNFILKDGRKVAPAVCYESVFGEYMAKSVKKGAGAIVIITNDGWWRNTPGYKQHMSFARLRAVETRRSIIRSANTGISCLINQRGDVVQQTGWWEETALKGIINYNQRITFYVEHGDYIARIALFISALLILLIIVDRFKIRQP